VKYEVCAESAEGVRAALAAGADRVELCADLAVGGTTPSAGLVEWSVAAARAAAGASASALSSASSGADLRLGVHVLIRPRGGDFVYDADEAGVMARDIQFAKTSGADGVVIGALTPGATVDILLMTRLIGLARPLSVTFHRAFDETADPLAAFGDVLGLGADRLLTSGGAASAPEGAEVIAELVGRSAQKIAVMAGGGVTERTAADLARRTGVPELHFSARSSAPGLPLAERIARIMAAVG
jgi:copper homeostasis protein